MSDKNLVVEKRKENPIKKQDLLTLMLEGRDPKTGEAMTDKSIVDNVNLNFILFDWITNVAISSLSPFLLPVSTLQEKFFIGVLELNMYDPRA